MSFNELEPYFSFWNRVFAFEKDIQSIEGFHFVSKGPYLDRDLSRIYIFKVGAGTVVVAREEVIQKISSGLTRSEITLDQKRLNELVGTTEKIFDDIDHHLPAGLLDTWGGVRCEHATSL